MKLAYHRTGPQSDLPLVLLHALPLDGTMWDAVRTELADIDILTVDAPGFGASLAGAELSAAAPNMASYVAALHETLQALEIDRMALGGLSMGGAVAADFTASYPAMIAGLALMDTNIDADTPERRAGRERTAAQADAGRGYRAVEDWTTTMVGSAATPAIRKQLDAQFRQLPNAGLAWIQRAMAARSGNVDAVELVSGPVYLVRGAEDPTCSLETLQQWSLRAQQPHIVEIAGAGHFTAVEKPAELASVLREFYEAARA
ncbi:MAG: alpha/beta hydrolase [Trueperella sp.]|nr:alpha/beta hydrolase [Trueperella sp.]